jgi:predicted DsbA family dithiol-disulfide isomerase
LKRGNSITLEVFTDYVCPWCFLSTRRIEKLKENYSIDVRLVLFPLHPETPAEGLELERLFAGRNIDVPAMHARMKALMDAEGLPYGVRTHTYNSRLAQELGKWGESVGVDAIHDALYRAYFADGRDISKFDVLIDVARSVGLPEDGARDVLSNRTFKDAVDADWAKARAYGVTGVPTFVSGGQGVVGAQPYEVLERLVQQVGAEPREM